jgi:predicted O-methyltransferase YrrM
MSAREGRKGHLTHLAVELEEKRADIERLNFENEDLNRKIHEQEIEYQTKLDRVFLDQVFLDEEKNKNKSNNSSVAISVAQATTGEICFDTNFSLRSGNLCCDILKKC